MNTSSDSAVSPQHTDVAASRNALDVKSLRLVYGDLAALDDVSLAVEPGEFVALLGPSGCGKTSLLRSIAGFSNPQEGAINLGGVDVLTLPPRKRNIGMVFQNYALFPHLTAIDNVKFGLRCRRMAASEAETAARDMLRIVGLSHLADRRPAQLSGGQQQRVALARALVIRPKILLLDEALGALDRKLRVEMQTELRMLQKRFGVTAVFVTHDQEEALAMADRIAVMRDGKIEQIASPRVLFSHPSNRWVAEFMGGGNLMTGRLSGNAGDYRLQPTPNCSIELPEAEISARGLKPGDEISVFVRTDRMVVSADENGMLVVGNRFLGAHVEVHAQDGDAPPIKALVPSEHADALSEGSRVKISALSSDSLVLA